MTQRAGPGGVRPEDAPVAEAVAAASDDGWRMCLQQAAMRRAGRQGGALHRGRTAPAGYELYAPLLMLAPRQRFVLAHLAQSIDGFIATGSGSSRALSGAENHRHLHRLRALSDAIVIGTSTAALDDPRLTTRLVEGEDPVRVVLDPNLRLAPSLQVFRESGVPTLVACAPPHAAQAQRRFGRDNVLPIPADADGTLAPAALLDALAARALRVVFVEGGGVTVSRMAAAGCLDRLQVSVSPVLVGDGGRPGIRLPAAAAIADCARPPATVWRLGADLLWDFDMRCPPGSTRPDAPATLPRRSV